MIDISLRTSSLMQNDLCTHTKNYSRFFLRKSSTTKPPNAAPIAAPIASPVSV